MVNVIDGVEVAVNVTESESVTAAPVGGVPDTVAVFTTEPASTSDCVTVYVAEHVVDPPGTKLVTGHVTADNPGNGSATVIAVRVTLPVFNTTKLYVTV